MPCRPARSSASTDISCRRSDAPRTHGTFGSRHRLVPWSLLALLLRLFKRGVSMLRGSMLRLVERTPCLRSPKSQFAPDDTLFTAFPAHTSPSQEATAQVSNKHATAACRGCRPLSHTRLELKRGVLSLARLLLPCTPPMQYHTLSSSTGSAGVCYDTRCLVSNGWACLHLW